MTYNDFKKQAGLGDAVSWGFDKAKSVMNPLNSVGIWSPIPLGNPLDVDSYRVFTPFADKTTAFSHSKKPSVSSIYNDDMTAQQKVDAFQNDVRHQVNKNVNVGDAALAGYKNIAGIWSPIPLGNPFKLDSYRVFTPFADKTTAFSDSKTNGRGLFGKLTDKAMRSEDVKAAADRFVQASDISDIANYQKQIDAMASKMPNSKAAEEFKQYISKGLQTRVWDGIKQDPLKNIPVAAGIFLRQIGLGKAGDIMSNPIAFYGSILGLIGGALLLGSR